jgi:hypothetical protein
MIKPLLTATALLPLLLAAQGADPAYQAANVRISTDYRADKAACGALAAQPRDLCYEYARARRKVARAELEYADGGRARDQHKVLEARAEAAFAVASARCSGLQSGMKEPCLLQARSVEGQALADAGPAPPAASPRPEGSRAQRAALDTLMPAASLFKAVAK